MKLNSIVYEIIERLIWFVEGGLVCWLLFGDKEVYALTIIGMLALMELAVLEHKRKIRGNRNGR